MIMNKNHFYLKLADEANERFREELNKTYFRNYIEFSNVYIFPDKYFGKKAIEFPLEYAVGRLIFIDLTDNLIVAEILDTPLSKLVIKENNTYKAHLITCKGEDGTVRLCPQIEIELQGQSKENTE